MSDFPKSDESISRSTSCFFVYIFSLEYNEGHSQFITKNNKIIILA
jgi:hypothetical protein